MKYYEALSAVFNVSCNHPGCTARIGKPCMFDRDKVPQVHLTRVEKAKQFLGPFITKLIEADFKDKYKNG